MAFLASLYVSNNCIRVSFHTIESEKVHTPLRIAVISDFHSKKFKNNNEDLYAKLKSNEPDLILTVGDMVSQDHVSDEETGYLGEVVASLCEIAPVYFSLGNHERHNSQLSSIEETVTSAGATILDGEYTDITVNGNSLRIGGLSYYRSWDTESNSYLKDFLATEEEVFTLLLCHHPEFYVWGIKNYSIDLTASGHTHGGMVRLPFVGGLYAPEQGWFPEYDGGLYEEKNGYLAVTTGLASSPDNMPRIFNRPEIMIIEVT